MRLQKNYALRGFLEGFFGMAIIVGVLVASTALLIGWYLNVLTLIRSDATMGVGEMVARIIGMFIPFLGGVLGYL